jgi:homoserine O-acetyltransferase/O-succinyltransferase
MKLPLLNCRFSLCRAAFAIAVAALAVSSLPAKAVPADGEQQFAELGNCDLDSGKRILGCDLGYQTWGKLNAEGTNAVLIPTWFTGRSSQWAGNVGVGKMVDSTKYFVIVVDALGNGISSSPSTSKIQWRMSFPAFTTRDMVRAEYRLATETLHLRHLHAVMGVSMGAMQTFEWMVDYPTFMDLAIPIVGSTQLTSYDLLLWRAEEDAIRADPGWHDGKYAKSPAMLQVAILHDMNLTTPSHYAREFSREAFGAHYEDYRTSGATEFDANDRLYQLEAMIGHDVAHGGSLEEAAKRVHAKVLVVAAQQDHMVNPAPALEFAKLLGAQTLLLTSDCGHLAPGCEADKLNPVVRAFLDGK